MVVKLDVTATAEPPDVQGLVVAIVMGSDRLGPTDFAALPHKGTRSLNQQNSRSVSPVERRDMGSRL